MVMGERESGGCMLLGGSIWVPLILGFYVFAC